MYARTPAGTIARCCACKLLFTDGDHSNLRPEVLYDSKYFTEGDGGYHDYLGDEASHRRQARTYLNHLAAVHGPPGRLLDVGCASGFFLDEAQTAGWFAEGCEVCDSMVKHARDVLALQVVRHRFLDGAWGSASFDAVTLFNVFEHLTRPHQVEERLFDILRPGGSVLIETWDSSSLVARLLGRRWHQLSPRYVPFYYTHRALRQIFRSDRWEHVSWKRAHKWISLERGGLIVSDLLPQGWARALTSWLARSPVGKLHVPYFAGDLVLLTLRRR